MKRLIACALLFGIAAPAAAGEKPAPDARAKFIAPFFDELTLGVVRVDLAKIDLDALAERLTKLGKLEERDAEGMLEGPRKYHQALTLAGAKEVYALFTLTDLPHGAVCLVVPLANDVDPAAIVRALGDGPGGLHGERIRGAVVLAPNKDTLKRMRGLKPAAVPDLDRAFAAAGDGAVTAVAVMPPTLAKALGEVVPEPPPPFDGSVKLVTRYLSWAAGGLELAPKLSLKVTVQAKNAESAKVLERLYNTVLDLAAREAAASKALPNVEAIREVLTAKVADSRLTLNLEERVLTEVLTPAVAKARASASRAVSVNNLKQMALAMHNYLDIHKSFPPAAARDKKGKALLSWRVHILPFIEQDNLYRQFKLDEPWDSEHNKRLIARMPPVYRSPLWKAGPGKTTYVVPVGKDTIFPPDKATSIRDIADGTSNTILIVEADDASAVIWTKPDDLPIDPKQPRRGLPSGKGAVILVAFADGSVRTLSPQMNLDTLRALFTRAGGEVIGQLDD